MQISKEMSLKKTRAGKPKVRTGCQTCKTRRLKCGEEKPCCLRCCRSGFKCDGYQNNCVKTSNRKNLLPRLLKQKSRELPLPLQPAITLNYSPTCEGTEIASKPKLACDSFELLNKLAYTPITFSSPEENRQKFASLPKLPLSPPFSPKRNNYFCALPHRVNYSPTGIYASPLTLSDTAFMKTSQYYDTCSEDQKNTFTSCNRRESCQCPADSCLLYREVDGFRLEIHCTFFTCLLFHIFENFNFCRDARENNEQSPSLTQVTTAIRQIREWVTGTPQESLVAPNFNYFTNSQSQKQNNGNNFHSGDALLKTLESYVSSIAESRTREKYAMFWQQSQDAIRCIPQMWSTLDEARKSLVEVVERNQHWLRLTMYLNFSEKAQNSPIPIYSFCSSLIPRLSSPNVFLGLSSKASERTQMLEELSRWDSAFQPLLNASHMSCTAQSNFLVASVLRMQWLASWIIFSDEEFGDYGINTKNGVKKWTLELSELSDLAVILLREWPSHTCFWKKVEDRELTDFDNPQQMETPKYDVEVENHDWFMQHWIFSLLFLLPLMTISWHYRHRSLRTLTTKLLKYCLDQDSSVKEKKKEQDMPMFERNRFNEQIMAKVLAWLFSIEEESWRLGTITTGKSPIHPLNDVGHCCSPQFSSVSCSPRLKIPSTKFDESSICSGVGVKSDYIPDWARASHVSMSYDDERKGIKVCCYQAVGSLGSHDRQVRDVLIPW